ncbi:MAG: YdcH family protein [Beijerinckiaceae bacterium]
MTEKLSSEERVALLAELERLRQEHRDLDAAIEALGNLAASDRLQIQRLKKRKLVLRDRIAQIEDQLTPDIIA